MNALERMVWVDLETTGLDPKKNVILEIGVIITDAFLNELIARSWVVGRAAKEERENADPIVRAMHDANGLWDECESSTTLLSDVETHVIKFIVENAGSRGPICGSSPHFDKSFLDVEMPDLARHFNHRVFDVSTLKQAMLCWTSKEFPPSEPAHRALADVRGSIAVARECRSLLVSGYSFQSADTSKSVDESKKA